jgi:RHS repeat-associated protein
MAVVCNRQTYYPVADANGNITDYVATNGTVVAHREFDVYGNTLVATGHLVNDHHFWFSSKYLDEETGFYYYGYRYYSPELGRWLSRDAIGARGGVNIYHFVFNNPICWIDYHGLWAAGIEGREGAPDSRGHSDFPGHDVFNYTLEDTGETSPLRPESTWRHFRPLTDSEHDLVTATKDCNKNNFQRAAHQMQDFFAHYGQGYRASANLNYATLVGSGHGLGTAGSSITRTAGIGVARPDNAVDYARAYEAARIRSQDWTDRWKKCCCASKDSWVKIPRRSESDCGADAPANPWGETAPAATPETGYLRRGWDATSGVASDAAVGAWNSVRGWF